MNKNLKHYMKYLIDAIAIFLVYLATFIPASIIKDYDPNGFISNYESEYILRCLFLFIWVLFTAIVIYKRRQK